MKEGGFSRKLTNDKQDIAHVRPVCGHFRCVKLSSFPWGCRSNTRRDLVYRGVGALRIGGFWTGGPRNGTRGPGDQDQSWLAASVAARHRDVGRWMTERERGGRDFKKQVGVEFGAKKQPTRRFLGAFG